VVAQERTERRTARAEVLEATRSSRVDEERLEHADAAPELVVSAA
jgi:hypothetical protein